MASTSCGAERPGRSRRRYRRCRWSRRDRCRRERRPCGRLPRPSGRCPWSSCRPSARLPAGYISCTSMLACFFIRSMREQGPLIWLPTQAGTPSHLSPALPRYLHRAVDFAVLLDERLHDVVDGLELFGMRMGPPCRHREDVVAGLRLRFGGDGQQDLVALARDVVDRNLDLLLGGPFIDEIGARPCWRRAPSGPRSRSKACRRRGRRAHKAR